MGCIPFCCCCINFTPKTFTIIALACNIIKLIISFISLFAIIWAILLGASLLSFFEIIFTITNLVHMSVILCYLSNKKAFVDSNKCCKILCIISLILSGLIIIFRILTLIIIIALASATDTGGGFWAGFIITFLLFLAIEVIHFLSVYYLYRLLTLKADCSYNDYLRNGTAIEQNSVTINNNTTNQNTMFPTNIQNNMGPPVGNNMIQNPPSDAMMDGKMV